MRSEEEGAFGAGGWHDAGNRHCHPAPPHLEWPGVRGQGGETQRGIGLGCWLCVARRQRAKVEGVFGVVDGTTLGPGAAALRRVGHTPPKPQCRITGVPGNEIMALAGG